MDNGSIYILTYVNLREIQFFMLMSPESLSRKKIMKLSSIETSSFSRKSHARARFQESQFRLFYVQNLEYWQSALFYNSHIEGKSCSQASWFAREWSIAHIIGERHTDGTMQISQLRQSWEIVERGSEGAARGCERDAGRKGLLPVEERKRGRTESISWGREQPQAAGMGNMQHECMRDALGNDIGIMAEHGTNEMTNGPTDWNRGPGIGAPSKEGHGVIIQANKGRSCQDYRVLRAAPHPVAPGPLSPCRRFPPVCP